MSDYIIVAVHIGHNSSCAIMRNGVITYAAQEERFTRVKNQMGFPLRSLKYGLKKCNVEMSSLSGFYFTTKNVPPVPNKANYVSSFSIRDWHDFYGEKYYKRKLGDEDVTDYLKWLRDERRFNAHEQHFDFAFLTDEEIANEAKMIEEFRKEQVRFVCNEFGVSREICHFLDHNDCHAYYAYYASPFSGKHAAIVTLDAGGDGANQIIHTVDQEDKITRVVSSNENEIGRVFKIATLILGMRPHEHEYKLMGLAPYAKTARINEAYEALRNLVEVKGLRIVHKNRPKDLYEYLTEEWRDKRFDNIAGAAQLFAEEVSCRLFEEIGAKIGVTRFLLSGGISMNVKMNKAISELPHVKEFFVCGSGADESLSIGGCYFAYHNSGLNEIKSHPLSHLYLGYDSADDSVSDYEKKLSLANDCIVKRKVTSAEVAEKLALGDIVARFSGRAEFGARALGNRSILADPSKYGSVKKINEAVKNRDFWMPFALSVLSDCSAEYIKNPKGFDSPFMSMSFETCDQSHDSITAGTHPYDRTVRPQLVYPYTSPDYYELIYEFKRLTGVGALLNTSFNLHGYPIVNDINDAFETFMGSDIHHLLVNDILYSKKKSES